MPLERCEPSLDQLASTLIDNEREARILTMIGAEAFFSTAGGTGFKAFVTVCWTVDTLVRGVVLLGTALAAVLILVTHLPPTFRISTAPVDDEQTHTCEGGTPE